MGLIISGVYKTEEDELNLRAKTNPPSHAYMRLELSFVENLVRGANANLLSELQCRQNQTGYRVCLCSLYDWKS